MRTTHLRILSRNLDLIEFSILELGQVVTQKIQRLNARSRIKVFLLSISPTLEPTDIFVMRWLAPQEIFLVFLLLEYMCQGR